MRCALEKRIQIEKITKREKRPKNFVLLGIVYQKLNVFIL